MRKCMLRQAGDETLKRRGIASEDVASATMYIHKRQAEKIVC